MKEENGKDDTRVEWYVTVYDSYSTISNKCHIFKLSQAVQTHPVENVGAWNLVIFGQIIIMTNNPF